MNDRALESFVTIVKTGSFTAAAEALYLSQPALSQQIRALEAQMGVQLFDRTSRHTRLTAAGQEFYPKAQQLLQIYQDAVRDAHRAEKAQYVRESFLLYGCTSDEFFRLWLDIYELVPPQEAGCRVMPLLYADREALYQALAQGKIELTLQPENEMTEAFGFAFYPLAALPEYAVALSARTRFSGPALSLQELSRYRLVFHHEPGYTVYEDELRGALCAQDHLDVMENPEFFQQDMERVGEVSQLLLVPASEYPRDDDRYARPICWGKGIQMGFVCRKDRSPRVQSFIAAAQQLVKKHGTPWPARAMPG